MVVLAVVLGLAQRSEAQPGSRSADMSDAARSHFRVGETLYKEGRFADAAAEFDKAYELSKRPGLLYNSYLAYRDGGMLEPAADRLRRYLDEAPDEGNHTVFRSRLASLEAQIAANKDAQARAAEQARRIEEIQANNAREARQEEERKQAAAERERALRLRLPAIVVAASGGVLLLGGGAFGVAALVNAGNARQACPGDVCPFTFDLPQARSTGFALALTSDILLGLGVAAAATGLVLWLVSNPKEKGPEQRAVNVGALCGTGGCAASLHMSF